MVGSGSDSGVAAVESCFMRLQCVLSLQRAQMAKRLSDSLLELLLSWTGFGEGRLLVLVLSMLMLSMSMLSSSLMSLMSRWGVQERRLLLLLLACTCMFVKVSIKGSGHDAASVCTALFPSSPSLPSSITLPTSLPLHLLVGLLGPAVACGCSLPPLMMQVPRHCMLLLAPCVSVSPSSMVGTRGVQGISESRSQERRCALEVLVRTYSPVRYCVGRQWSQRGWWATCARSKREMGLMSCSVKTVALQSCLWLTRSPPGSYTRLWLSLLSLVLLPSLILCLLAQERRVLLLLLVRACLSTLI